MINKNFESEQFQSPSNEYRPSLFWSINDWLDPDKLRKQVREFGDAGFGGWFFHVRGGMPDEYLGDDFFESFAAAVDEGEKSDQLCWIYDEDGYPSGTAGVIIPGEYPEYCSKRLWLVKDGGDFNGKLLASFIVNFDSDGKLAYYREASSDAELSDSEELIHFIIRNSADEMGMEAYVDALDEDAIAKFIEVTGIPYEKRFKEKFGQSIPGVFTDEPRLDWSQAPENILWSAKLLEKFNSQNAYDMKARLPELFFPKKGSESLIDDFNMTIARMFREAFIEQWAKWCEERDLIYTGHGWEHNYPRLTDHRSFGYAFQPMQWPGIDMLGGNVDKTYDSLDTHRQVGNIICVKSISGLANQFGRERIMSETFGGGGWDMTFRDFKEILDWQSVLGINYYVYHLSCYSTRGMRKRDYPPCFTSVAAWWDELKQVNDYAARLCHISSIGENRAEITVLQPLAFSWRSLHGISCPDQNDYKKQYEKLLYNLSSKQWEYDLTDEMTLIDFAKVENNKLCVGQASYKIMIVPLETEISEKASEIIAKFANAGGTVLRMNNEASELDDLSDRLLKVESDNNLPIFVHSRQLEDGQTLLFWSNVSDKASEARFSFSKRLNAQKLNLLDGAISELSLENDDESCFMIRQVAPGESEAILLMESKIEEQGAPSFELKVVSDIDLSDPCEFKLDRENTLVLDQAKFKLGDDAWSETSYSHAIIDSLREKHDIPLIPFYRLNRTWRSAEMFKNPKEIAPLSLKYEIKVKNPPLGKVRLHIECAPGLGVSINDVNCDPVDDPFTLDHTQAFKLDGLLKPGVNEIIVRTTFRNDSEIESLYLVGDFGVSLEDEIIDSPTKLNPGSISGQGLPYFAGRISVMKKLEISMAGNYLLEIPQMMETGMPVINASLDGRSLGSFMWAPYQLELGELSPGTYDLELQCVTGMINMFGPRGIDESSDLTGPYAWKKVSENNEKPVFSNYSIPNKILLLKRA